MANGQSGEQSHVNNSSNDHGPQLPKDYNDRNTVPAFEEEGMEIVMRVSADAEKEIPSDEETECEDSNNNAAVGNELISVVGSARATMATQPPVPVLSDACPEANDTDEVTCSKQDENVHKTFALMQNFMLNKIAL